jgi:LDH2 family malate/lactate/ureidoglycolate dehydrogenase
MPAEPYPFWFDAATTVVPKGKLEVYNKAGKDLGEGWAVGIDGKESTNAEHVLECIDGKVGSGGILPVGGSREESGSHKGYGFSMICEIFSSILSMGDTSNYCMQGDKGLICHGFAAIDPAAFGDPAAIKAHLSTYLQELRDSPKAEGQERIYTHGEKEAEMRIRRREEGIPVNDKTFEELRRIAGERVAFPW